MEILNEDILEVKEGLILHGVNCQGVMGAGLAKKIRDKWPWVNEYYHGFVSMGNLFNDKPLLGSIQWVTVGKDLGVVNCFTQQYYGRGGKIYADIGALRKCLWGLFGVESCEWVERMANEFGIHSPLIGSGLGGLPREDVLKLYEEFEEFCNSRGVKLKVYEFRK